MAGAVNILSQLQQLVSQHPQQFQSTALTGAVLTALQRSHQHQQQPQQFIQPNSMHHVAPSWKHEPTGPLPSMEEFVADNNLDPWVIDALYMMTPEQRVSVISTPLNTANTHNPHGLVVSRMKAVTPTEQRLDMFIKINGLADGVIDRLSTLTSEQQEEVMESSLKIQKASNPSGVAMRRITDALRNSRRPGSHSSGHIPATRARSRTPAPAPSGGHLRSGSAGQNADVTEFVRYFQLETWIGEVLNRLSLYQRQQVLADIGNLGGVRNPSGVVMSRVKTVAQPQELTAIFIDINGLDEGVQQELSELSLEQQAAVIAPGIYVQNVRNPSTAVRSRIAQVLAGNDAMGAASHRGRDLRGPHRTL